MWRLGFFVTCLFSVAQGSKILFEAHPDVLIANLTKSVTMRCSLNDTDLIPTAGGVIGKRDVTQTSENMKTITSLVITRSNGDHVATVIQGQPPRALADLGNIHVTGQIGNTGNPGEEGYIELTWDYPTSQQAAEYMCEVNTISALGHNVVFSSSLEIGEQVPTIGELVGLVQNLEKDKTQMENQLAALLSNLTHLQATPTTTPPTVAPPLHVEQGRLECDDSDQWHQDSDYGKYTTVYHRFSTQYSSPPAIQTGVNSIDHEDGANTRYDVTVASVDRDGFTIKCKTWSGPEGDSHLYHIYVDWISMA